jgi:hypothetical protein
MKVAGLVSLLGALTVVAAVLWDGEIPDLPVAPATLAAVSVPRPLPFFYDLYTFRGDNRTTTVVASFAVPAGRLERETHEGQIRYRFDVTLVLSDTLRRSVSRTDDSVYVRLNRPVAGEHLLYTHIEVRAPPSRSTLQRVIMTDASRPGIGQLYASAFPIPDYRGEQLMLSDVALAQPNSEGGWRRGDITLALLPTSLLPGSSFDIYYEIYNLPPGNRYETEISVEKVDEPGSRRDEDDAPSPVRTRFVGESSGGRDDTLRELRHVQTSLDRGRYRLTVVVTDHDTGSSARRSRYFRVQGSTGGATLVPALPWKPDAGPVS